VLWEYQKHLDQQFNDLDHALFQQVTIEHIFPQNPGAIFPAVDFQTTEQYAASNNLVGNLTLLEHSNPNLQKLADNLWPTSKLTAYKQSRIPDVSLLCQRIPKGFTEKEVERRTAELQVFALQRWA
jgi:hypothetical protein